MRVFWLAFLGKLAAAIFIAACVFYGFGPDEWVRWVMPETASAAALLVARILFLLAAAAGVGIWVWSGFIKKRRASKPAATQVDHAYPDWNLRDLFFHLSPGLRQGQANYDFMRTGQQVMDKLSLGQLQAWGRMVGNPTLSKIDSGYWMHAEWTYWFLDEKDDQSISTTIRQGHEHAGQPKYRQVMVNKAQAISIWSKPLDFSKYYT